MNKKKEIVYKVVNGTYYHEDTSNDVIAVLEEARNKRTRILLDLGNVKTGESWNEIYDITGYVGRSTGQKKVPILLHNSRSIGGSAILSHCIISIYTSLGKKQLYKLKK